MSSQCSHPTGTQSTDIIDVTKIHQQGTIEVCITLHALCTKSLYKNAELLHIYINIYSTFSFVGNLTYSYCIYFFSKCIFLYFLLLYIVYGF